MPQLAAADTKACIKCCKPAHLQWLACGAAWQPRGSTSAACTAGLCLSPAQQRRTASSQQSMGVRYVSHTNLVAANSSRTMYAEQHYAPFTEAISLPGTLASLRDTSSGSSRLTWNHGVTAASLRRSHTSRAPLRSSHTTDSSRAYQQ
jgi:hypothetical protein